MAKLIENIDHHSLLTKHKYVKSDEDSDSEFDTYNRKDKNSVHQIIVDKKDNAYNYYPPEYTGHYNFNKKKNWSKITDLDNYLTSIHK